MCSSFVHSAHHPFALFRGLNVMRPHFGHIQRIRSDMPHFRAWSLTASVVLPSALAISLAPSPACSLRYRISRVDHGLTVS